MFAPRQLLKRSSAAADETASVRRAASHRADVRHPAMRGLDISPVHGRHCICGRCQQHAKTD